MGLFGSDVLFMSIEILAMDAAQSVFVFASFTFVFDVVRFDARCVAFIAPTVFVDCISAFVTFQTEGISAFNTENGGMGHQLETMVAIRITRTDCLQLRVDNAYLGINVLVRHHTNIFLHFSCIL